MSDLKTLNAVMLEKSFLERDISDSLNMFIRDNPDVKNIEVITSIYVYEGKCGESKDVSVYVKLTI